MTGDHDRVLDRCRRDTRHAIPDASDELIEEVAQDLALRWQRARDAGASVEDADDRVRQELAGWPGARAARRSRRMTIWTGWTLELRHALRTTHRRPMFTLALAALTAMAVAANVAAFAVTYGLLWRPLPYPGGDRLAALWQVRQTEEGQISLPDYRDLTAGSLFDAAAVMSGGRGSLRVGDRVERVNALQLELPGFAMLGATPVLGRLLRADAAGLALTAVALAIAGLYAIVAISVAERTREIGIRAAPGDLLRRVLREGAWTAILGGMVGSAGALGASRLIQAQLFNVSSPDVAVVICLVALGLVGAAVAATIPPARRAARADPLTAMRPEW